MIATCPHCGETFNTETVENATFGLLDAVPHAYCPDCGRCIACGFGAGKTTFKFAAGSDAAEITEERKPPSEESVMVPGTILEIHPSEIPNLAVGETRLVRITMPGCDVYEVFAEVTGVHDDFIRLKVIK